MALARSLAVLWLPSCGAGTGDLVLASSETAGSGFQSWWGGVAGGVSPGRASHSVQGRGRAKQRGELTASCPAGHPHPSPGVPSRQPQPQVSPWRGTGSSPAWLLAFTCHVGQLRGLQAVWGLPLRLRLGPEKGKGAWSPAATKAHLCSPRLGLTATLIRERHGRSLRIPALHMRAPCRGTHIPVLTPCSPPAACPRGAA